MKSKLFLTWLAISLIDVVIHNLTTHKYLFFNAFNILLKLIEIYCWQIRKIRVQYKYRNSQGGADMRQPRIKFYMKKGINNVMFRRKANWLEELANIGQCSIEAIQSLYNEAQRNGELSFTIKGWECGRIW